MGESVLIKDTELKFPHFTVLKASAGSGKTRTLTERLVQFLVSERIPRNSLGNMLAITFSNNAAKEMKERTLSRLKEVYFGDGAGLGEFSDLISLDNDMMQKKAGLLIEEILASYSDFQIKTIDSFMTTVFKASAIDFGYNPDFDILMSNDLLMGHSFNLFMRKVKHGTAEAVCIEEIVDLLLEQKKATEAYLWDPSTALLDEIKKIYRKLSSRGKNAAIEDYSKELSNIKDRISELVNDIEKEIGTSGLARRGNSSYVTVFPLVREKRFPDLIGKGFANPPVNKPKKNTGGEQVAFDRISNMWSDVGELTRQYTVYFVRTRCMPCVKASLAFSETVELVKKQQGKVFIEDINMQLASYLSSSIVPDVYFRMGETIFHFLIDEFQDTSPIQWENLSPLIENSLSQGGSLFVVGDTKQAIYGFRNADYTIMKGLEKANQFPSAGHSVRELDTNYRSRKRILEFNERVFRENLVSNDEYREAGARSGLTEYIQKPRENIDGDGYAEVSLHERNDDEPAERKKIQELIEELCTRGYRYGDIAVLTQTNEDAVSATTWLNEKEIPFISHSSLDVRRRKITGEIISLMNFLDAPTDDFSFGTFILGDVFKTAIAKDHPAAGIGSLREFCFTQRKNPPLYKAFQGQFSCLWEQYFDGLFRSAGFLPLYDLVTEVFAVFRVFEDMPEEEAALIKILEVVKDFEGGGFNSLKDFLETALDDEKSDAEWDLAVPKNIDAVQVMTVHKAKGLGFPVVIVLLYEVRNRGFEYIVEDNGDTVCLLKINKTTAACDNTLQNLYDEERMSELVNRLNSLYVGFTRPEKELYVIGVKGNDKTYPFVLLPAAEFAPSAKPLRVPDVTLSAGPAALAPCRLLHHHEQLKFEAGPEKFLTVEELKRGEFIHRVLSFIDLLNDSFETELQGIITLVREETGSDYPDDEIKTPVIAIVRHREMERYFTAAPGRLIRKEQEYSDKAGRLFRMDRVIIDNDGVTVIDYKTGKDRESPDKYTAQLKNYMSILRDVYPGKTVRGIIAFVDLVQVESMQ